MIKVISLLISALTASATLTSCNSGSSTPAPNPVYYSYGHRPLPGTLSNLPANYRPNNLNSKTFINNNKTFSPADIQQQDLQLTFDVQTQKAKAHSVLLIKQNESSFTYFQMGPPVQSISVDGTSVTTSLVNDPDGIGKTFVSPNQILDAGVHTLILDYDLPTSAFSFQNGGIGLLTDMSDLPAAHFFEAWAPAGFEEDAFELHLHLQILNSTSTAAHQLFTNGTSTPISTTEWQIDFPKYFTTSSIYFHLTNKLLVQESFTIQGAQQITPVTIYSTDSDLVAQAKELVPLLFKELESTYGPYPHPQFLAYIHSGGGGMEYSGATITAIGALGHELFHSWFGRGWQPAEGRSGWIDEAFASWRDYNYFQSASLLSRAPTKLSTFSPYENSTATNCYRDGRRLIAELDQVLADFGGMKPLMKLLIARYQHQVITVEEFQNFLAAETLMDLSSYFKRFAFGENAAPGFAQATSVDDNKIEKNQNVSKHPSSLTAVEVHLLR